MTNCRSALLQTTVQQMLNKRASLPLLKFGDCLVPDWCACIWRTPAPISAAKTGFSRWHIANQGKRLDVRGAQMDEELKNLFLEQSNTSR